MLNDAPCCERGETLVTARLGRCYFPLCQADLSSLLFSTSLSLSLSLSLSALSCLKLLDAESQVIKTCTTVGTAAKTQGSSYDCLNCKKSAWLTRGYQVTRHENVWDSSGRQCFSFVIRTDRELMARVMINGIISRYLIIARIRAEVGISQFGKYPPI